MIRGAVISIMALLFLLGCTPSARARSFADAAAQARVQPKAGQEEFVPISQLPSDEQLPAAPLLMMAYAFIWLALLAYVWSLWRRQNQIERELESVKRRLAGGDRL